MNVGIQLLITVGGILLSAYVAYRFAIRKGRQDGIDKAKKDVLDRVTELERQLAIVGSQVAPFNTAYQAMLIKQLTHYHTPKMDALMKKLGGVNDPPTITEEEEKQLIVELKKRTQDMGPEISEDERDAAEILPVIMRRVKREAAEQAKNKSTKMVDIQVVGRIDTGEQEE